MSAHSVLVTASVQGFGERHGPSDAAACAGRRGPSLAGCAAALSRANACWASSGCSSASACKSTVPRRQGTRYRAASWCGNCCDYRNCMRGWRTSDKDAAHKLTTDLSRRFETIVIEDLNVSGKAKNHSLAGAVLDCGFHEIRRQFRYKQAMRGGRVVVADRFYPSTQICSRCGCLTGLRAVRKCMSRNGFAANAAPSTRVTATPPSA